MWAQTCSYTHTFTHTPNYDDGWSGDGNAPPGKWLRLDTATITILQPKRLEKKDYRGRKKNLKYLQTTTYVPNGFVYACARTHAHDKASLARCESSVLISDLDEYLKSRGHACHCQVSKPSANSCSSPDAYLYGQQRLLSISSMPPVYTAIQCCAVQSGPASQLAKPSSARARAWPQQRALIARNWLPMTTMMMSVARINYLTEWPPPPAGLVGGQTRNKNQVGFQPPSPTLFV